MTNDPGHEIRDRFRATPLPPAPVRLRERLAALASGPGAPTPRPFERARLVLSLVAVLAIASIGLVAAGGLDEPGPSPSALTAEATAEATADSTPETTAEPYPFEVVCEEADAPALTCAEVVHRVLGLLHMEAAEWGDIDTFEVTHRCDQECSPAANFVVMFVAGNLVDGSVGPGELFQLMSSETDAPTPCIEEESPEETCRPESDD